MKCVASSLWCKSAEDGFLNLGSEFWIPIAPQKMKSAENRRLFGKVSEQNYEGHVCLIGIKFLELISNTFCIKWTNSIRLKMKIGKWP